MTPQQVPAAPAETKSIRQRLVLSRLPQTTPSLLKHSSGHMAPRLALLLNLPLQLQALCTARTLLVVQLRLNSLSEGSASTRQT